MIVFADDPHNVVDGESDTKRAGVINWWDESMSSRLNDPKTGRRVVIMQRVHETDLVGHLIEKGGWEHLCIPNEFQPKRKCFVEITGWEDPRTEQDELMWPDRIDEDVTEKLKLGLGPYAYAAQYDQDPTPRKGTMIDVDKIEMRTSPSDKIKKSIRAWDKAGTDDAGARTAGVLIHLLVNGRICIGNVVKGQWAAAKRNQIMKATAAMDGKKVKIWIEQEGGSGGKESAENSVKELAGYRAYAESPKGDKEMRAEPFAIQVAANNVECLIDEPDETGSSWSKEFIEEARKFPVAKFKDQIDATSLGLKKLTDTGTKVHVGRR